VKVASEFLWRLMARKGDYEDRQKWLALAGWDPAWVFHNWKQLPEQLRADLCWKYGQLSSLVTGQVGENAANL